MPDQTAEDELHIDQNRRDDGPSLQRGRGWFESVCNPSARGEQHERDQHRENDLCEAAVDERESSAEMQVEIDSVLAERALDTDQSECKKAEPAHPGTPVEEPASNREKDAAQSDEEAESTMTVLELPVESVVFQQDFYDLPRWLEAVWIHHADSVARHACAQKEQRKREKHRQYGKAVQPARRNRSGG